MIQQEKNVMVKSTPNIALLISEKESGGSYPEYCKEDWNRISNVSIMHNKLYYLRYCMEDTYMNFTLSEKNLNAQNHLHTNYKQSVQEPVYLHNTMITIILMPFSQTLFFLIVYKHL
jgi:hypothetical protein